MITFNIPPFIGPELDYIRDAVENEHICGDGKYTRLCSQWMEKRFGVHKVLMTTSGSSALDMAALLCGIQQGDEVILPSYTFSSTANAFILAGARLVFVDIRPDTMNMDETKIEAAITEKTRVIVPVHYAGVSCEMDRIMEIAHRYGLLVVEDAAQGVMSRYRDKALGTIGDFGCYSFHETKNYSMGEGGAIAINRQDAVEKAEILREKGTDRSRFFRGQVDKYTWVDYGDSFLPSELNTAYLWAQLEKADEINQNRLQSWRRYYEALKPLEERGCVELPGIPGECEHNAHMFYLKAADLKERTKLIAWLKSRGILSVFHYIPLHSAPAGLKYGRFSGEDVYTTRESERLLRLPLYFGLSEESIKTVTGAVYDFYA